MSFSTLLMEIYYFTVKIVKKKVTAFSLELQSVGQPSSTDFASTYEEAVAFQASFQSNPSGLKEVFCCCCIWKIMQTVGFLGPAFFVTQLSHINSPGMAVLCMAWSQR